MTETIEQIALRAADAMPDCSIADMAWGKVYVFEPSELQEYMRRCLAELAKQQEPVAIADGTFNHACELGQPLYPHPATPRPVVSPDFAPDAHRLALELECLLLSSNDTAAVSAWWDSAHEALEQHRALCAEITEPKATDVEDRKDAERLKEQRDALLNAAIDAVYQMRRYDFTSGRLILLEAIQEATGDTEATITARREGE